LTYGKPELKEKRRGFSLTSVLQHEEGSCRRFLAPSS
jgi:hypothetical protein